MYKKICTRCKKKKSSHEFYRQKTKHGFCLTSACKECMKKASRRFHAHAEEEHEKDKRGWQENIAENRIKGREIFKQYYKDNAERVRISVMIKYFFERFSIRNVPTETLAECYKSLWRVAKTKNLLFFSYNSKPPNKKSMQH